MSGQVESGAVSRRSWPKRLLQLLRRAHMYFGLFLFPWAILYGVTGFLFNHPTVFSDQPTTTFGPELLHGTALENLPALPDQAEAVLNQLNEKQKPAVRYRLCEGPIKYSREFAFATVKANGQTISLLFDVKNGGGTIRTTTDKPKPEPAPKTPFSAGPSVEAKGNAKEPRPDAKPRTDGIALEHPLQERVRASVPVVLVSTGTLSRDQFRDSDITVTSVPDLVFPVVAEGRTWTATYNPMTGAVSGTPAEAKTDTELSWRRFFLRLHTAHGYPGETNARWYWAIIVDAMAFVMVFWGLTGLIMWWQIKATRRVGAIVLTLSAIAATTLGISMHSLMIQ